MAGTPPTENWGGAFWEGRVPWPVSSARRVYDLAVRLEVGMTHHSSHPPFSYELSKQHGEHMYGARISAAMEKISMGAHVGTHVDAPGHVSLDGCVFGDREVAGRQGEYTGVAAGSVEELPPLFGPGHLVDGVKLFERAMTPADGFGAAELERWFARRAEPVQGDIVVFRTGWMQFWEDSPRYRGEVDRGIPGVSLSGAQWLSRRGVRAVGADTVNFEHKPEWDEVALSVHVHLLVENGVPIMESLNLEGLAADGVERFYFAAAPLRLGGGTGSPIRPLAFVSS
ncbi:cyclase family protein [Leucobacter weissii]|uniref:Cyclase family protein n=1 Tax=Leucobacter weissii TaxID=1983706 RepID=A0A939MMR2_9MICO|nr:cyclase family protein [Leucobacter weissii]MBO1901447.1 cyclase family protein [Leucobacter weissii]